MHMLFGPSLTLLLAEGWRTITIGARRIRSVQLRLDTRPVDDFETMHDLHLPNKSCFGGNRYCQRTLTTWRPNSQYRKHTRRNYDSRAHTHRKQLQNFEFRTRPPACSTAATATAAATAATAATAAAAATAATTAAATAAAPPPPLLPPPPRTATRRHHRAATAAAAAAAAANHRRLHQGRRLPHRKTGSNSTWPHRKVYLRTGPTAHFWPSS